MANMTRFVMLLPSETHEMLEMGAHKLQCSKAHFARILIDTGAAIQPSAFPTKEKHTKDKS